jgi:3-hydroxybutyryl-CoA dehydrogenase
MDSIKTVAVAGCGTMGVGIAIVAARAGFQTLVFDSNQAALSRFKEQSEKFFEASVAKGKLSSSALPEVLGRFKTCSDLDELSSADIVIEAIFEELSVKNALFLRLNEVCSPHTIFASNTSTISISEIAGGSGRDDRVVGMHFCLPAPLMKLVEMSPGLNTSNATFNAAWNFCEALGQTPVKTKDSPGFILNYFLIPFHNNVIRMVDAGIAEPRDIDTAIKVGMGYAMGPMQLLDLVGMDTQKLLSEAMVDLTHEPDAECPALVRRMIAAGRLGKKSGRGFYQYENTKIFGA